MKPRDYRNRKSSLKSYSHGNMLVHVLHQQLFGCVPPFTLDVIGREIGRVFGRESRPLVHDHSMLLSFSRHPSHDKSVSIVSGTILAERASRDAHRRLPRWQARRTSPWDSGCRPRCPRRPSKAPQIFACWSRSLLTATAPAPGRRATIRRRARECWTFLPPG